MAWTITADQGFDETYYLQAKAVQMGNGATAATALAAINAAGMTAAQHYSVYGYQEGLEPNAYFNSDQYAASKAAKMGGGATASTFELAWYAASGSTNVYQHYVQYGAFEAGVEPSTGFNDDQYYVAKAAQMGGTTTAAQAEAAIKAAGLNAISHYQLYGKNESLAFTATPTSIAGQTFTLTTGADYATTTAAFLNGTVPSNFRFTNASETIYGASTTFTKVDILKDSSTTDQDTLKATFAAAGDATAADGVLLQNIENMDITLTAASGAAGTMSLANVTGMKTITISGATTSMTLSNYASSGVSTIDASAVTSGAITINPTTTTTTNMTIKGGAGNDVLGGSDGKDVISGGAGNDIISGGAGDNTLSDVSGTNTITASNGANTITGGTGVDTITVGSGNNTIVGGGAADVITTGSGDNTITVGDAGSTITTANGANTITGGSGVDTITTGNGDSVIVAKGGADSISVGTGNNTITGGTGADTITLAVGVGANTIKAVNGDSGTTSVTADAITGFITNSDQLSLGGASGSALNYTEVLAPGAGVTTAADMATALTAANTAFAASVVARTGLEYYASVNSSALAETYLFVDYDHNGAADAGYVLKGINTLAGIDSVDII